MSLAHFAWPASRALSRSLLVLLPVLAGCLGDSLPDGHRDTPLGSGPRIVWDLGAEPLPELPLPNDVATYPDPDSPTGLRLNVSTIAPTHYERTTRGNFDRLDGWGTYAPISIPFEEHIDLRELMARQGGTSAAFSEEAFGRHAIYLINMTTGVPVPIDINHGNFQFALDTDGGFFDHDRHFGRSNLLFEDRFEDTNRNGVLDPGEDLDYDGVLDEPNTFSGLTPPEDPAELVDEMTWFYERETKTLILKPVLPLEGGTEYAVVVTDRLVDERDEPVRSPFPTIHHFSQKDSLDPLPSIFSSRPALYGDLASRGFDGVAFAWTFTTQTVTQDLTAIRDGLYGRGPLSRLSEEFPTDYAPAPAQGGNERRVTCPDVGGGYMMAPAEQFVSALESVLELGFSLDAAQAAVVIEPYKNLSHVVVGFFDSPYFLGDPNETDLNETFQLNRVTGEARIDRETIAFMMLVPKDSETQQQPFPAAIYVHGYGSAHAEPLPYGGFITQNDMAGVVINAEDHSLGLDRILSAAIESLFEQKCLLPLAQALQHGRAHDINGNGVEDSGANFWTAYVFHTRDVVRQTIVDHIQLVRLLRSFDGRLANPTEFADGLNGEPTIYDALAHSDEGDIAGDFDGDGRVDVGGPGTGIFFSGGSLGGIMTGIMAAVEPSVTAAAPIVGAGGLIDVGIRSDNGGVINAMHLRMMGPFVSTRFVTEDLDPNSACAVGDISLRFLSTERARRTHTEFACAPADLLDEDDVIVVHNLRSGERSCAGATDRQPGAYRVAFAADADDEVRVEIHQDAVDSFDFANCQGGDAFRTIQTWESGSGSGDGTCSNCGAYQQTRWSVGDTLVSPGTGFGNERQTPDLRRLFMLAQIAIEDGDPINYAKHVILEPKTAEDVEPHPRNLFVINSIGDQNVPLSAGNAYARAAGVLPFLPPDAPNEYRDFRAPASFQARYPGFASPNDLLIGFHVLEGVDRFERHPDIVGGEHFLYDVDVLAEGRFRFQPDGRHQSVAADALSYPRLDDPLRWSRQTRAMQSNDDDVWNPAPGGNISGLLNHYVIPNGVHGFDEIVYDPKLPFDASQYLFNLLIRYGYTQGRDIRYLTDPNFHHCLEDSTCSWHLARSR